MAIILAMPINVSACQKGFQSTVAEMAIEMEKEKSYLGEFTITHYCGCRKCNGRWYDYPAKNGEPLQENWTVAVDPNVIPLNTYINIEGYGIRKAQDTGSAIKGNKIDVYVNNHELCYKLGVVRNVKVYTTKTGEVSY